MYIETIEVKNFRLIKNAILDVKKDLSLLLGKNNSGKTSFLVLFEKFYNHQPFTYNDFPLSLRNEIKSSNSNKKQISIQMIIKVKYNEKDNLEKLSEFILDLDINNTTVNILFEVVIDNKLYDELGKVPKDEDKERFLAKSLNKFLKNKIYAFESKDDLEEKNRWKLIEKKISDIHNIINFHIIHAKRNVSSSEEKSERKKTLSLLASKYFNKKNKDTEFNTINEKMIKMDEELDKIYTKDFDKFLKNTTKFLEQDNLKVISQLESKALLEHSSGVIYGSGKHYLPEHLNGLGYMNILYLLLNIEIIKDSFEEKKRDINLFFIEEPEAHTHQQMQSSFIKQIKDVLNDIDISNLQTVITTHSSHIVAQCEFKDIRYFFQDGENVEIKNFYEDLEKKYKDEKNHFKFLAQYLTLSSAELFFATKIIFIEGATEQILLPYFMKQYDKKILDENKKLSSQNISILEVGANGRVFKHFLDFLGIRTLIITDIDTTKEKKKHEVKGSTYTSNYTLKYYLNVPSIEKEEEVKQWMSKLKNNELQTDERLIKLAYQIEENGYHARSFEDAFISKNIKNIKKIKEYEDYKENKDRYGLQNLKKLEEFTENDFYNLTNSILKSNGKSDFASSLLYLALTEDIDWDMPSYIEEGLRWIAE